jgi:4-diphosphocytidyl-2-C-methyl-D-erythritol kinase
MKTYLNKPYKFPAPAKLNLFLHVVGQRNDGYHELETLFQFLDYSDTLEITVTTSSDIVLLTPLEGVDNKDNLIVKAAKLLQEKFFQKNNNDKVPRLGAVISIDKILPMGGGLGGGSSNAATILVALNTLWQCNFSVEQLSELGLGLGADVPIFIHGFAAFAQGVGEKLSPVQPEECWYLISKPHCSISTASVFTSSDLPRDTEKLGYNDFHKHYCDDDLFTGYQLNNGKYHNDCQTMVIKHYDKVANLLAWLIEYAPSRMTGTGACVFSSFPSKEAAVDLQAKLPKEIDSFIAKGLNKSSLLPIIEDLIR